MTFSSHSTYDIAMWGTAVIVAATEHIYVLSIHPIPMLISPTPTLDSTMMPMLIRNISVDE
jgi:hypothetical protein